LFGLGRWLSGRRSSGFPPHLLVQSTRKSFISVIVDRRCFLSSHPFREFAVKSIVIYFWSVCFAEACGEFAICGFDFGVNFGLETACVGVV
jgi:hypothetical protein